ncbi:MAG: cytochrome B6 [Pirellulaceae bacterium]
MKWFFRSVCSAALCVAPLVSVAAQQPPAQPRRQAAQPRLQAAQPRRPAPPPDAVADAQTPRNVPARRPEQKKTEHDLSEVFSGDRAPASSPAFEQQPKQGQLTGFDFARDPLGAARPFQKPEEIMEAETAARPKVTADQKKLLEGRFDLQPRHEDNLTMTRGKPICVGPTARLAEGVTWQALADLPADEIRRRKIFPYPSLPHPLQTNGGQVFPAMQIEMFPRLARFDVEFDLPEAFLPEFPPAIFLQNRPELGDVSRGEVVSINNYYKLFKDLITPVQLDGLRLLLTPFPQEEFNPTDDRKSPQPSLGVTCFDCHVNGHTTGQFHLNPDTRPQHRRMRLDTTSLRGMFAQQIHGSKRSLRSVEDFTEFEQRTAYFNGDAIHAMKKGMNILDRIQVSHMAQFQNMLDFPPAPKLDSSTGRLYADQASPGELRGEKLFFGKAKCDLCHPAPAFMDQQMHDLHLEKFLADEPGDGPIKSFTLRGIKESPPYLHDGRCLTLEDTVEFFNLVLELKLSAEEKTDLTAYLRQL